MHESTLRCNLTLTFASSPKRMFSSSKELFRGRQCPSIAADKFCRLLWCPFDHPERVKREGDVESDLGERVKRRKLAADEGVAESIPASGAEKIESRGTRQDLNQRDRPIIASFGAGSSGAKKHEKDQTDGGTHKREESALGTTPTTVAASGDTSLLITNDVDSGGMPRQTQKRPSEGSSKSRDLPSLESPSESRDPRSLSSLSSPSASLSSPSSRPKSALEAVKATPNPSRDHTLPSRTPSRDAEHLLPTTIFPCPATVAQRIAYLKAIHTALTEKRKLKFPKRAAILEELAAAKRSGGNYMVYTNECRVLVKSIKDGSWRGGNNTKGEAKTSSSGASSGLTASISNQLNAMATKIKPLLAQNGYPINPDPRKSGLPSNIGIQHCDRCNKAFDVPKVDNYGSCKYHWARPRLGGNTNMPEKFYPCCNQPVGVSEGCEEAPRHVYKLHDLNDLAFVVPFRSVTGVSRPRTVFNGPSVAQRDPDVTLESMSGSRDQLGSREQPKSRDQLESTKTSSEPPTSVVAVDCEMLYTSLGMELCRVTCVDYLGKKTLDRVVRPTGRILDYNTRFSGISDINEPITTETGEKGPSVSFEEAHRLISALVNKQTVLVGHGLENDLIAMRLIHDRIVDTSILYPDFNPKYKTALKTLALRYLKRTIQTGEHDSMEDALAALDVVKFHLKG